ncbi:MAG: hypothetical protein ACFFB5_15140 [Promethearchaeota archaeon]
MHGSTPKGNNRLVQENKQLIISVRSDPLLSLVIFQFLIFGIIGLAGFVGWLLSLTYQLSAPGYLNYIADHLEHWTANFSLWGVLSLCVGFLSFGAAILIRKNDLIGASLELFAFLLGFATNMIIARNPPAHIAVGAIIGWILIIPTLFYLIRLNRTS